MRRLLPRSTAVGVALFLLVGIVSAGPATGPVGAAEPPIPSDQPLPPYTIVNPPLAPALVAGAPTTVRQGTHEHAGYVIEVPPAWNGDLVMWAHGNRGNGTTLTVDPPAFGLRQRLLDQGYAWAASSFAGNGWDVRTGVLSTKALADLFGDTISDPHRIYLAGVSMGGHVIGRSLEQYRGYYQGALPLCGALGDQALFDYQLDYNLVAQDLADVPAYPIPTDYLTVAVPQIFAALGIGSVSVITPEPANDLGRQFRSIIINRSGGPRPGADASFAFWKTTLFSLSTPSVAPTPTDSTAMRPGRIATNALTLYRPTTPVNVNKTIRRVLPEDVRERLSPLLTQVPMILGRPSVPVLSLHGLGDLFVPFSMEQRYALGVVLNGQSSLLVQRAIRTTNHCEFSPTEVGAAWDALANWVKNGVRPAGDKVLSESIVAAATYGCAFSDPAAFAAGTGTRRLFTSCPTP